MMTRRGFLVRTAAAPLLPGLLGQTPEDPRGEQLPDGVIRPFSWGGRDMPVTGEDVAGTEVVDEAVKGAMREHGIVGCGVCVIRGDALIYSKGFGLAELPNKPFTRGCASRCGSLAKPVSGLAALLLVDQGKLDLDEPVCPILAGVGITPAPVVPATPDPRIARITVRHLLDHTSGLPRSATYTAWRPDCNVAERQGLKHIATAADIARDCLGNTVLTGEPGEKHEYANANFVLLARVIEARGATSFGAYLAGTLAPTMQVQRDDIYVSRNQLLPESAARGGNEAAYYQTSDERFVSFVPSEAGYGKVWGEAYRGYATESSDGAGGLACTAHGIGALIANLNSVPSRLSGKALDAILTPPSSYAQLPGFDPARSSFYSKGFVVRFSGGRPWFSHGGMTIHCGGVIGHNAGYQFVAVSNWNNAGPPYVDVILDRALAKAMSSLA